jgi:hypothetical protein
MPYRACNAFPTVIAKIARTAVIHSVTVVRNAVSTTLQWRALINCMIFEWASERIWPEFEKRYANHRAVKINGESKKKAAWRGRNNEGAKLTVIWALLGEAWRGSDEKIFG